MKWFEKSVEYKFVIESTALFDWTLVPLAGNEEVADLEIENDDRFLLIEFKKDNSKDCFDQEMWKYEDRDQGYLEAKENSQVGKHVSSKCHLWVRGISTRENHFELQLRRYFSVIRGRNIALENLTNHFVTASAFCAYLNAFIPYLVRGATARPNPNGPDGFPSTTIVLGLSKQGIKVIPVKSFVRALLSNKLIIRGLSIIEFEDIEYMSKAVDRKQSQLISKGGRRKLKRSES